MSEKFYEILSLCLPVKKWRKYYSTIIFNLIAVNEGYKTSLLWDIGPPVDAKILSSLVISLKGNTILNNFVFLFKFESEIFIVNIDKIDEYFLNYKHCIKFVDCSFNIDKPYLIGENTGVYCGILDIFNLIENYFSTFAKNCDNEKCGDLIIAKDNKYFCPVTVFGILLGYPVVYWCDNALLGNCLSYIQLTVYKLSIDENISENLSYTPVASSNFRVLYSFSAPTDLSLDKIADSWYLGLGFKSVVTSRYTKENVILPHVAL